MTPGHSDGAVASVDQESAEWLRQLTSRGRDRDEGLRRLHQLLLRACSREAQRRSSRAGVGGPELDDVANQAASDAMLAVLGKLHEFRGESRFTTWVYKFAMFEVSAKLGRHYWNAADANLERRLDTDAWLRLPDRLGVSPAEVADGRALVAALRRAVERELTDHQRKVFVALVVDGVPLDALVLELGSSRGAVYKTMFDARRKLRAVLVADGYLNPGERG
ncbi:RNA polymerase sigma factor [Dactylosporangium sp. CA-092794]|uniref:RNA polymerase sigma factor n=1 Tax=Dactylosporangium sp. CA-092794 TaxID=3239929 RepID=UPI003D8FBB9E